MVSGIAALSESESVRTAVGAVVALAGMVALTPVTVRSVAPVLVVVVTFVALGAVKEHTELSAGTDRAALGAGTVLAAVAFVAPESTAAGIGLAAAGLWVLVDGLTLGRYGPVEERHEYVTGAGDDGTEVLLRMQTLSAVTDAVRVDDPRTAAAIADDLDLTESRVLGALDYLADRGQVERTGDGRYRAVPSPWGALTPAVRLGRSVLRRLLRPARRATA